jgi:DNA polymerase III delta' subunit
MAFQNITGNSRVKKILKLALRRQRVPNSLLFCGPEGVGKRTMALVLAKALNCLQKTDDACEECPNCKAINKGAENREKGGFPDVMEIFPATEVIKIEQMTEMKKLVYLKPMTGRKRIFIINEAEKMTEDAANSHLKILEEPPLFSHIILISSNSALLLPTIKSRCRPLNFLPVAREEIEQALRERGLEEEKARITALLVRGNIEQALELDWEDVQQKRQEAWNLFLAIVRREESSRFLERFSFERRRIVKEDLEQTLELFYSFCRDFVLLKERGDARLLFNPDYAARFGENEKFFSRERALRFLEFIEVALANLDRNLNIGLLASSLYSQAIG